MTVRGFLVVVCLVASLIITGCLPQSKTNSPKDQSNLPVGLDNLEGMFSGFRDDFGGDECGGMCWDFYTFLPKNKVLIGLPENGGPETIDCKRDECLDYSISDGQLTLSNGESYPIILENDTLIINKVKLNAVQPVPKGTTLDNHYTYIGYRGLIGVTGSSSSWTYSLSLYPDETFELSGVTLGSLGANTGVSTHTSSSGDAEKGNYKIENNTITLTSNDGTVTPLLFFIHDSDVNDIQVGNKNYYVKED
ncbi:hypothetical protein [Bacillus niameyensis]|uniref:hypothetical protein n=1 Tax=Bacillus niameyensis TaxID=1522308 RepID=UPI00078446D1|nr:hypothetical protein [Bacillus niameyensis]